MPRLHVDDADNLDFGGDDDDLEASPAPDRSDFDKEKSMRDGLLQKLSMKRKQSEPKNGSPPSKVTKEDPKEDLKARLTHKEDSRTRLKHTEDSNTTDPDAMRQRLLARLSSKRQKTKPSDDAASSEDAAVRHTCRMFLVNASGLGAQGLVTCGAAFAVFPGY